MKFFTWLFGKKEEPDLSNLEIDEKNDYGEEKKNKFNTEESDSEESFYIHKEPKPVKEEIDVMVMSVEKPDQNSQQATYMNEKGEEVFVSPAQLNRNVPDGLNIPGVGTFKGNQQRKPRQPNPQNVNNQVPIQNQNTVSNIAPSMQQKPPKQPTTTPQPKTQQNTAYYPPTEVAMVEGAYHLYVDMAGVDKENISIVFDNDVLVISGTRQSSIEILKKSLKKPKVRKNPILQSNVTVPKALLGKFEFRYPFRRRIDEPAMQAKLENGLLQVVLPHRIKGDQVSVPIM